MDNFTNVYNDFYNTRVYALEQRRRLGLREPLPQLTVEIIRVWDTVGLQKAWLGRGSGERLELRNTVLHESVKYAFHALALDEEPKAFQPTVWNIPQKNEGQELLQVWFSRSIRMLEEATIPDCRISLKLDDRMLSFDIDEYLFDHSPRPEWDDAPWATSLGEVNHHSLGRAVQSWLSGKSNRTPLAYNPPGHEWHVTNEVLHESTKDHNLDKWPCPSLQERREDKTCALVDGKEIVEATALEERYMKGRIWTVHVHGED
ncbi:hypothetical protein NUU61_008658 [Penicillium alfredii]|uniref:T6SS Phospholipase effector Tle1-like catalytic domain-containing protein n=1 Tax=Penicillium alfredii TaxID=1506179 RepID=A0A9W9ELT8_9EURO|nr:uncharacterized protein NUU61_008658 [Penicillium alfredii]KAJ5084079.1 hypothetical protein NUU61_008658 [Penicillium alfredii]